MWLEESLFLLVLVKREENKTRSEGGGAPKKPSKNDLPVVAHDLMAAKLIVYAMFHSAVKQLISYLRHHKQSVKIVSDTSDWMTILKCVPQGSILGPSLFNLFFNDFMYILKHTSPVNYAVDNTLG